jgi:hypothetical protein
MTYRDLITSFSARRALRAAFVAFVASALLVACGGGEADDKKTPVDPDTGPDVTEPDTGPDVGPDTGPDVVELEPAALSIDPMSSDFGSVLVGETSSATTFTVTNDGEEVSSAITTSLSGADASAFDLVADNCASATLAEGETCTIEVTFNPGAEGNLSADLSVSAADGGDLTATLEGIGLSDVSLSISPTPEDFGTIIVDEESDAVDFTVTNNGDVETAPLTATLSGGDALHFETTDDNCTANTLMAGDTCVVSAVFKPTSTGTKSTTLRVVGDSEEGAAEATLNGNAVRDARLRIDDSSHDFGSVVEGNTSSEYTFTISNDGDLDSGELTSTWTGDDGEFDVVSDDCDTVELAAGDDCSVVVRFQPTTAGSMDATLTVTADPGGSVDATLTGQGLGQSDLDIDPASYDFGSATVGSSGGSHTFTITNNGGSTTGALSTARTGANATDFQIVGNTCQNATLAQGAFCTISVEFSPNNTGTRTASLTVNDPNSGTTSASLTGQGDAVLAPAELSISPATGRNFGSVAVGESETLDLTVTNIGDETSSTPDIDTGGADFSHFNVDTHDCNAGLAGGDSCTVTVRFEPTSTGDKSATLEVVGTPDGGSDSASLRGTGITAADLSASPTSANFDTPVVNGGVSAGTLSVVIENGGAQATGSISTTIGANFAIASDTCTGNTLNQGANCTIDVEFTPGDEGDIAEDLVVEASPGGQLSVPLSGESLPKFTIDAPSTDDPYEFNPTVIDTSSAAAGFTVTNTLEYTEGGNTEDADGSADRTFSTEITGTHAAQFSLSNDNCDGETIVAGDTCALDITFEPTGTTPGTRTATLEVTDDTGETKTYELEGEAEGQLTIDPADHDFGEVTVGDTVTQTFAIEYEGNNFSGVLSVNLTNNAGSSFGIVSDTCSGDSIESNLTSSEFCEVEVVFFPQDNSTTYDASLTVSSSNSNVTADLTGAGTEAAAITLTPDTGTDFGDLVATTTGDLSFTVENTGDETSTTLSTALSSTTNFSVTSDDCDGETLDGGATCAITVTAEPSAATMPTDPSDDNDIYSTTLTVSGADSVDLWLDVLSQLTISPAEFDFEGHAVGTTSATEAFEVEHVGGDDVSISGGVSINSPFVIDGNNCPSTLTSGDTCQIDVEFSPSSETTYSGSLVVEGPQGAADRAVASLEGEGLQPTAVLEFVDTTLFDEVLGYVLVGKTGEEHTFTLQNNGTDTSATITTTLGMETGEFNLVRDDCDGQTLAADAECDIVVEFAPTYYLGDTSSTWLSISMNDGSTGDSLNVRGFAQEADGLEIIPQDYSFGDAVRGEMSTPHTFTIQNRNQTVTATNLQVDLYSPFSDSTDNDFCYGDSATSNKPCPVDLQDNCTGIDLLPGNSCTVEVAFLPQENTQLGRGYNHFTSVNPEGNGLNGFNLIDGSPRQEATLSLNAEPNNTGNSNVFPRTANGDSLPWTFTLENNGWQSTGSITTVLDGAGKSNSDWFTITDDGCSGGLDSGESCEIEVTFSPTATSADAATKLVATPTNGDVAELDNIDARSAAADGLEVGIFPSNSTCDFTGVAAGDSQTCEYRVENTSVAWTGEFSFSGLSGTAFEVDSTTCVETSTEGVYEPLEGSDKTVSERSCQVWITYAPTSLSDTGSATFEVTTDPITRGGSDSVTLSGEAESALTSDATDGEYDFGQVTVDSTDTQTFTFTNASNTPWTGALTSALSGADDDQFAVTNDTCVGETLDAGDDCTVTVTYYPTAAGDHEATLTVTDGSAEKEATVNLMGEGTN